METVKNIFAIPELRRKLAITFSLLVLYRFGFHIPLPGIDTGELAAMLSAGMNDVISQMFGVANVVSGGAFLSYSLFSLGIMPYISASIIFQLLTKVVPALEKVSKEGPSGQQRINQWTRMATVPLCAVQSAIMLHLLATGQLVENSDRLLYDTGWSFYITGIVLQTAGGMFLVWVGELINDHGIGNGISLLIMAGIIAGMVPSASMMIDPQMIAPWKSITLIVLFILIVIAVVLITQAQRRIPVQQAKHQRGTRVYGGQRTYIPLRVNQAGVMPIIFASSLLIAPQLLFNLLFKGNTALESVFDPGRFWYTIAYIGLTLFFCFFWTSLMFQPKEMATNLKEYGSFIQGIRPGKPTARYLEKIMLRITLAGGVFLAFIAVLPQLLSSSMDVTFMLTGFLGGTGLLIIVGVVLDFVQKVESHLLMRHYEGFLKGGGKIRGRRRA